MRKSLLLAALLFAGFVPALQAGTQTINYQGQLTDLSDNTINSPQNMAFELYDAVTAGNLITSWAATSVPVTRGLFNVELTLPTLTQAQLSGDLYLQVTVGGNVMSPRKRILYSVLAVSADSVQGLVPGSSGGNIPVILTSTGKLDPSILSAPFPLVVSGTGSAQAAAGVFNNQDPGSGQVGLRAIGQDGGIVSDVRDSAGTGIRGNASPVDDLNGTGVLGVASAGVGVRAQANNSATTALQAINTPGLGIFASGDAGALFSATTLGLRVGGAPLGGQTAASPITGIEVNSQGTGIAINNNGSGPSLGATNASNGVAIEGKALGANAIAVRGAHNGVGFGTGVWGQSDSVGGTGVHGEAGASSGSGVGVDGSSGSLSGVGVKGSSPGIGLQGFSTDSGSSGANPYGVAGNAGAVNGHGLHGIASGSGAAYGVFGVAASSASGAGVLGQGLNLGVVGSANSNVGAIGVQGSSLVTGVEGDSLATSGPGVWGVRGSSQSPAGVGVEGRVDGVGTGGGIGVSGKSVAAQGLGVRGEGTLAGVYGVTTGGFGHGVEGYGGAGGNGLNRAGLYGSIDLAPGELGYGIYGTVNGTSGDGYAIYAYANSSNHRALRAYNTVASNNDPGYALGIEGKLKIGTSNAGFASFGGSTSSWQVSSPYVGAGDTVIVTPAVDISAGGSVLNAVWVSPADVLDGNFTVRSAQPIGNFQFYYLVIDKD
jgi:hypothetical protein